jgi:hypothetical protein
MKVLSADRLRGQNPLLTVYSDDIAQEIFFEFTNVNVDVQRRANVKEGLDLYIKKEEVTKLDAILSTQIPIVANANVMLDQSIRLPKDPRATYNALTGLPIPIASLGGWCKIKEVRADYTTQGYSVLVTRTSNAIDEPSLHIEHENKATWDQARMHLGTHNNWTEVNTQLAINKISLRFRWEELGHLYGNIFYVLNVM